MIDHPGWRLRDQRTLVRHGWRLSAGGEHKHGISVGGHFFGKISSFCSTDHNFLFDLFLVIILANYQESYPVVR